MISTRYIDMTLPYLPIGIFAFGGGSNTLVFMYE